MESLRKLYDGYPKKIAFIDELMKFLASHDPQLINTAPIAEAKMVDLSELYNQVAMRGGFDLVCANNFWREVATACGMESTKVVYHMYQGYLLKFERAANLAAQQYSLATSQSFIQSAPPQPTGPVAIQPGPIVSQGPQPGFVPYYPNQPQQLPGYPAPPPQQYPLIPSQPIQRPQQLAPTTTLPGSMLPQPQASHAPVAPVSSSSQPTSGPPQQIAPPRPQPIPTTNPVSRSISQPAAKPTSSSSSSNPSSTSSNKSRPQSSGQAGSGSSASQSAISHQPITPERVMQAIHDLDSRDIQLVIRGTNILLQKSYEAEGASSSPLNCESYPDLILALGDLLNTINPLAVFVHLPKGSSPLSTQPLLGVNYDHVWQQPRIIWNPLFKALARVADENILLLNVLNLIRNLSFDLSNETILASSAPLLQHLVSFLLCASEETWSVNVPEVSSLALDILVNIASKLDFSGRRRQTLQNSSWLDDCGLYDPKVKKQLHMKLHNQLSSQSLPDYMYALEMLLGTVYSIVIYSPERSLVLRVVDLFSRLASIPDNIAVFGKCPDRLLEFFLEFLCTNTTISDPFHMFPGDTVEANIVSGINANFVQKYQDASLHRLTRIPPSTCTFFNEVSDVECRDAALEVIGNLAAMSAKMQLRVASVPNMIPVLLRLIQGSRPAPDRGVYTQRSDPGAGKASAILTALASRNGTAVKFLSVETEMCLEATADDLVGDIVCGSCLNFFAVGSTTSAAIALNPLDLLKDDQLTENLL